MITRRDPVSLEWRPSFAHDFSLFVLIKEGTSSLVLVPLNFFPFRYDWIPFIFFEPSFISLVECFGPFAGLEMRGIGFLRFPIAGSPEDFRFTSLFFSATPSCVPPSPGRSPHRLGTVSREFPRRKLFFPPFSPLAPTLEDTPFMFCLSPKEEGTVLSPPF